MPQGHWRHRGRSGHAPIAADALQPSCRVCDLDCWLSTYRASAHDDDHAWALYRWNLGLVAAFTPLACDLEVALRNAIHEQISAHFGRPDWWADASLVLDDVTMETLSTVVRKHQRKIVKGTVGPGRSWLTSRWELG